MARLHSSLLQGVALSFCSISADMSSPTLFCNGVFPLAPSSTAVTRVCMSTSSPARPRHPCIGGCRPPAGCSGASLAVTMTVRQSSPASKSGPTRSRLLLCFGFFVRLQHLDQAFSAINTMIKRLRAEILVLRICQSVIAIADIRSPTGLTDIMRAPSCSAPGRSGLHRYCGSQQSLPSADPTASATRLSNATTRATKGQAQTSYFDRHNASSWNLIPA